MNWWLVIIAVIISILVLGLVFYFVILYTAEEDKNQAWLPKVIVIFGLSLACFNVLLLPYDIANRMNPSVADSVGGGINVVVVWQIVMWCIAAMTFIIVPFAMFYYESQDPDQTSICTQLKPAICYTTIAFVVFLTLLIVLWLTVGVAHIPYQLYSSNAVAVDADNTVALMAANAWAYNSASDTLDIKVSIFVYMVGLMSALGWLLFFLFGGIGLAALPWDGIVGFKNRPTPITAEQYTRQKEDIGKEAARLVPIGTKLDEEGRGGGGRKHKKKVRIFKLQVAELEHNYEKLEISFKEQGGSVLRAWLGLFMGIIGIFLSLGWFLHIILWNITHVTPFLNTMFIKMDEAFALLGTMAYGLFAFYLLWCVVKGCAKFGLNFIIIQVHPMKVNGTLMNSFLFNTLLILFASVSTIQFCAISFSEYAVNTSVDSLFTTYVKRLEGLNYLVMYLQYPMIAVASLAFLYLLICPKRKPSAEDDDD